MPQQHTAVDQVNFLGQWFVTWSEMQREDFLPILVQAYYPKDHINGLLGGIDSLHIQGRRPSLFDCQVKLFHDWFSTWTENDRSHLLQHLREVDVEFMSQFDKKISGELSQEDIPSQAECGEEGQNPPSSVSSPPSTLPRSHSPHDSGLDEPPSDSDHTEPHSLDLYHDAEGMASSSSLPMNDAPSSLSSATKYIANPANQGDESLKLECVLNGSSEPMMTAPAAEESASSSTAKETLGEK
ncbi:uncharacterized protein LOC121867159 [Homarus americanus]|uniref:Uncharacterized protein n=1 Tax=Homarus americanus TaxID=6706 RepID=A0A8J5MYS1_HOMAM|nr:uncharacterized protein LOC121867159 [Homarus americanus]XP_042222855.1 uncharacterized protein LOC121867159 [Homarus americanus]XP_042222856.1 uncharacterized protein LOC121867159 [Homarus americanus]XP_042222857.1 uncharacterized protein LOC121867159 [Homarus americanus]XP_042222859.1 uncharacterized protein LOC121867159 [Homarus americanus]KAG7168307.1 hypothetical protein Hamer_G002329 [Homarus americanus]